MSHFSFRWVRAAGVASLAVAVVAFSGCNSKNSATPENFQTGLNKYFAERHLDCLFGGDQKFPEVTGDPAEQKKFDVLVEEQLLTVKRAQIARYEPTPYGEKQAPAFCYGERAVISIDSFTPPAKAADGFNQSKVTYHYRMENVPVWAKSEEMKKTFPEMAKTTSGNASATIAMAQTAVGWQVPE